MKITAMLAWWDEPVDELEDCVRSLPVLCDALVAVDGAYEMTPGATAQSPSEQEAAITEAAESAGLEYKVVIPNKVWKGQVEKRAFMLDLAVSTNPDWLLAVDADHRLVGDRESVRRQLDWFMKCGVVSVRHSFRTPLPDWFDLANSPHAWHTELAGNTVDHALICRCLDGMRIEKNHWGYTGVQDGQRIALGSNWQSDEYPQGKAVKLGDFRIDHVCFHRDQKRLDRNRDYCLARDSFAETNGYEP